MPIVPPGGWEHDTAGRLVPSWPAPVHDGVAPYRPQPADGDDYTFAPLIPRQWVPISEHNETLARLAALEKAVAELWAILIKSKREDQRIP